eukprot:scaffold2914_cov178-Amphora_coffeaeformis.AAC.12
MAKTVDGFHNSVMALFDNGRSSCKGACMCKWVTLWKDGNLSRNQEGIVRLGHEDHSSTMTAFYRARVWPRSCAREI